MYQWGYVDSLQYSKLNLPFSFFKVRNLSCGSLSPMCLSMSAHTLAAVINERHRYLGISPCHQRRTERQIAVDPKGKQFIA